MTNLECPSRPRFQADVEECARSGFDFSLLKDSTILITGATGLVGGALTRALLAANRLRGLNARVLAPVRDVLRARDALAGVYGRDDLSVFPMDVTRPMHIDEPVDYIVHGAGVTTSRLFVTHPVETIEAALMGARCALQLAAEKQVRGMVYLSSMEAFGVTDPALPSVTETQIGYIDPQSLRSSYSESKRMAECLCAAYAGEYGVPVRAARLAQTFGAGVSPKETRVFMQFARAALEGRNLVLHTKGESYGNYVYTADCVKALLLLLTRGENGGVYTVANPDACVPIKELARLCSETLSGGRARVVFDIPESALTYGYAPDVKMRLNADKMKALGWRPSIPLDEMLRRLAADIRSFSETN